MKVALGQFVVAPEWSANLTQCVSLIDKAAAEGAKLLVLPESIIAADMNDSASLCARRSLLMVPSSPA